MSKQQNPERSPKNTCSTSSTSTWAAISSSLFLLEQHLLGLTGSSQTGGVPRHKCPTASPALCPHRLPRLSYPQFQPGNANPAVTQVMLQPALYSFSFPQAFIYSVPCILHLQIFLLREGFLVKAAPACLETFCSTCFCIILKCFF